MIKNEISQLTRNFYIADSNICFISRCDFERGILISRRVRSNRVYSIAIGKSDPANIFKHI